MLNGKLHENLNKKNNLLNRYINSPGKKKLFKRDLKTVKYTVMSTLFMCQRQSRQ